MREARLMVAAYAILLSAGTALAKPTAQQNCDYARVTAWKVYQSCEDTVVANDAKLVGPSEFKAFRNCRHSYFKKWTAFQTKASVAGSTCVGSRYTDNGDQTVTDNLNGLVWEKKDNLNGTVNNADPHDADNMYTWSTGTPYKTNGTVFATFLMGAGTGLNVVGFAGWKDWRLPTLAEIQTTMLDFGCTGPEDGSTCICSGTCIDAALGISPLCAYTSATSRVQVPSEVWYVFPDGTVDPRDARDSLCARAVRGGF